MNKTIHRASKINNKGEASALCFKRDHPIDLNRASWTIRDDLVTCQKCKALIKSSQPNKTKGQKP